MQTTRALCRYIRGGSMTTAGRIDAMKRAAKKVIDSATHADYLGIVVFNNEAQTYQGLTTMARALPPFRERLKTWIDSLGAGGGTNFIAGFTAAFTLMDTSRSRNFVAGCHTTYVFVTDGVATDPQRTILSRQATSAGADEHYFVISLGSGTSQADLRATSCAIGAVYTSVPDGDEGALQRAMAGSQPYKFRSVDPSHPSIHPLLERPSRFQIVTQTS